MIQTDGATPKTTKKEAETKTEDDNKEDETKTEDDSFVAEDTDKDQEMVNNLKEIQKMLDEQLSYWETFVATAPGNNKEEEGSGDDLNKEEKGSGDKKADTKRRRRQRKRL